MYNSKVSAVPKGALFFSVFESTTYWTGSSMAQAVSRGTNTAMTRPTQRVAIARALINDPMMVLTDEPTGNLDPDLALEIMNLFREINARGTTVVVATHDRELIRQVGRRAIMLEHGVITEEVPAIGEEAYFGVEDRHQA